MFPRSNVPFPTLEGYGKLAEKRRAEEKRLHGEKPMPANPNPGPVLHVPIGVNSPESFCPSCGIAKDFCHCDKKPPEPLKQPWELAELSVGQFMRLQIAVALIRQHECPATLYPTSGAIIERATQIYEGIR